MPNTQLTLGVYEGVTHHVRMFNFTWYSLETGCDDGCTIPSYMVFSGFKNVSGVTGEEDAFIDDFWENHRTESSTCINGMDATRMYSSLVNRTTDRARKLFSYLGFQTEADHLIWRTNHSSASLLSRFIINEENKHNQGGH